MARRYWLVKSDPESVSFDDLRRAPGGRSGSDGVLGLGGARRR